MDFLIGGEIAGFDIEWEKGGEFAVEDGLIFRPYASNIKDLPIAYSPFDVNTDRPVYEAFAKLGKKLMGNDKPEKDIISFYKKYGPLDLYTFYKFHGIDYRYKTSSGRYGERIADIKQEAIKFYLLTQIIATINAILADGLISYNKSERLIKLLDKYAEFSRNMGDIEGVKKIIKRRKMPDSINVIYEILICEVNYYLYGIHFQLSRSDNTWIETAYTRPMIVISCPCLLDIIYLTYLKAITENKIGYCEICGGVLYKSSKNKRVHTDCSNRTRQKRHNKKLQ